MELKYNLTEARRRSQLKFAHLAPYSSFVLDVPKLLDLLHQSGALDLFTSRSRPAVPAGGPGLWKRLAQAMFGGAERKRDRVVVLSSAKL